MKLKFSIEIVEIKNIIQANQTRHKFGNSSLKIKMISLNLLSKNWIMKILFVQIVPYNFKHFSAWMSKLFHHQS